MVRKGRSLVRGVVTAVDRSGDIEKGKAINRCLKSLKRGSISGNPFSLGSLV